MGGEEVLIMNIELLYHLTVKIQECVNVSCDVGMAALFESTRKSSAVGFHSVLLELVMH